MKHLFNSAFSLKHIIAIYENPDANICKPSMELPNSKTFLLSLAQNFRTKIIF